MPNDRVTGFTLMPREKARDTSIGYPDPETQKVDVTASVLAEDVARSAQELREANVDLSDIKELQEIIQDQDGVVVKEALEDMGRVVSVIVSKKLAATTNYTAEDVLSEHVTAGTPYQFVVSEEADGSGVIEKATVFTDITALTPRITLYIFNAPPTSNLNDNVANAAPSLADHPVFEGQIDFMALEDLGGGSSAVVTPNTSGNLPLPFKCVDGSLYGVAVLRDAETSEVAGMTLDFKLQVRRD